MSSNTDPQQNTDHEQNAQLMRRATYFAVTVAGTLIIIKIWAYLATGSIAVLSTLVDSLLDLGASMVNLIAVRHALTPADDDHRFGHGKAEALAGLFQAAFIVGSAAFLILQAIERITNPVMLKAGTTGITVMVISIVLTLSLVLYQRYVIRKTQSIAISADALHYAGDLLVNASVIVAIVLSLQLQWLWADAIFAIGIALYLAYNAYLIVRQSFVDLMDEELPAEERQNIISIVMGHEDVLGVHDLRTRRSGQQVFIQMHIDLHPDLDLQQAHDISEAVEGAILESYPNAEALIHQDPAPKELLVNP